MTPYIDHTRQGTELKFQFMELSYQDMMFLRKCLREAHSNYVFAFNKALQQCDGDTTIETVKELSFKMGEAVTKILMIDRALASTVKG